MNTHKRDITIITVLSISAIVLALLLSRHLWFRLDLTRNHLYTISAVSRNLRNEIPDQVRITYYLSDKLAAMHPVPREIADMLREYAAYSRGKITVTVRDPVKAKLTDAVDALGVQAQQIQTEERNEMNFALVYSALVIEYLDKTDVVPWIFSLETLEYDLTSRIRTLVRGTQREAGILVGDAGKTLENNYRHAGDILTQAGFRVRPVAAGEEIPGGLSLLLVFGGTESLDHWALYRIDHYLRSGGKAFFAVEAVLAEFQGQPAARAMDDQGLLAMLSRYGATVQPELTLDRSALMLQYQRSMPNGTVQH
ncbi:MAG: GldG family protein, partial [Spirochaetaceae bacterium]|nr:GldG family protein [Spirochaetaceae bacterium]